MADKKVIVHIGEDYVTGIVAKAFLNDSEATGENGDPYYSFLSAITLIWNGSGWTAYQPNGNSNVGINNGMFGMGASAGFFGPDVAFIRKLETELNIAGNNQLYLFKFASNATLGSDATFGTWQKSPTSFDLSNDVFLDMETEWGQAKAVFPNDVLRVEAIIISHGKAENQVPALVTEYAANLKQFIKDVRYLFLEDPDDDPIPVILTRTGLTGGNYDLIRDAQSEMATELPYINVIDMDEFHIADTSDHRSGVGNIILGEDIFDAYLTATVADDIEEYTLATLRTSVREEFGIKAADTVQTATIDKKINEALLWIAKQRADWSWLLAETAIDIPASRLEAAVTVTQGERKVTGLTTPTQLRDIFIGGTLTGTQADGYLITSGSLSAGFRLQSKFLAGSISAGTATILKGFFKLPRNFRKMQNLELIGDAQVTERVLYRDNLMFDKIKRQRSHLQGVAQNLFGFYTIKPDPLDKTDDLYLALYPYPTSSRVAQCAYWKQPSKLGLPTDVPDLPRADRFVLLHAAFWFMSVLQKHDADRITFYRVQALTSLEALIENSDFGNEPDIRADETRGPFVAMPAGYPNLHSHNLHT